MTVPRTKAEAGRRGRAESERHSGDRGRGARAQTGRSGIGSLLFRDGLGDGSYRSSRFSPYRGGDRHGPRADSLLRSLGRDFADRYWRRNHPRGFPRQRYGYYGGFHRCYDRWPTNYYTPFYLSRYVPDYYFYGSFGAYSYDPFVRRTYGNVIYTDSVVVEPRIVGETYYTTTMPATELPLEGPPPLPEDASVTYVRPPYAYEKSGTSIVGEDHAAFDADAEMVARESGRVTSTDRSADFDNMLRELDGAVDGDGASQSRALALVEQGNAAFSDGEFREARRLYAQAMLAESKDGYAKLFYGLANFATNNNQIAAEAFRRALIEAPELIEDPIDFRLLYSDPELLRAQMAELLLAVAGRPGDPELAFLLGYMYFSTGEPEQTIATLGPLAGPEADDVLAVLVRDAALRVLSDKAKADGDQAKETNESAVAVP
ncbi:MAG: hypothetical protein KJ749_05435 [Planctomycetes bacterium]|nr:hypothetical protein [Planctomycetota bacterium]